MRKGVTVAEVAATLQCHPNTVKRIEKRLNLPVKRDYRNYRIYTEDIILKLKQYLEQELDPK